MMKVTLSLLLVLFFQQPTMKETVDWIQTKSNTIIYVSAASKNDKVEAKYRSQWDFSLKEPCVLQMRSTGGPSEIPKRGMVTVIKPPVAHPADPSTISIPLGSINPQKVNVTRAGEGLSLRGNLVTLGTTDNQETIVWSNSDKKLNLSSLGISFNDSELVDRILKALQHVVSLCGGKPDKKEPF